MTTIRGMAGARWLRPVGWLVLVLGWTAAPAASQSSQVVGPSTGGTAALQQALRMLGHNKRVLLVAAHPDDEDTELLTYLVRHEGAEAAYLSLSRGEGGQNLIGPELGEALGLIRSEELLAARRLDGARQYFARAFDFGFSKTLAETSKLWPRDSVLKDVVRIVRRFRPQIIVSTFSGTPRDGHGQHQSAGWAAQEAFRIAGDPARFRELERDERLAPWTPLKLYRSSRFDTTGATVILDGGELDPDVGQSYRQIAMRGRSLHRSQDMGMLQEMGPSAIRMALREDRTRAGGSSFFAGVDTTAPVVGEGDGIEAQDQQAHRHVARAIQASLLADAISDVGWLVPGQPVRLRLSVWNAGRKPVKARIRLIAPAGWRPTAGCLDREGQVSPGEVLDCRVETVVPENAPFTTPYFLREPRSGALYRWTGDPVVWGEPFDPPLLQGEFTLTPEGEEPLVLSREVVYRYRDQAVGEVRRPLIVVPMVALSLEPAVKVWSTGTREPQRFTVTLRHSGQDSTRGTVKLELPAGWPEVAGQRFSLTRPDEHESVTFLVRPPAAFSPGTYVVRAVAQDQAGHRYETGTVTVDYPHIRPRAYGIAAASMVRAAPVALPRARRVGYVRGASDGVPEALQGVGLAVEQLDAAALERGDFSRFDAIIIGSRAYETEPALLENNARLLEYVRQGGHLLVQYQQQVFFDGNFAPYPLTVGGPPLESLRTLEDSAARPGGTRRIFVAHDRVTDETAPVQVLRPTHPAFTQPNLIGPADWDGWIQERGLYFARTWDKRYTPLLRMSDPGEAPLLGGLLIASVGKGTYVYTGLSFFRQLPAGVPGAFRFFLNLIDLKPRAAVP